MTNIQNAEYKSLLKKAWIIYALLTIALIVVLVLFVAGDNEERFFFTIMPAAAAYVGTKIHFIVLLSIFAVVYFGICLPVFQRISKRMSNRKFIIRLGMAWNAGDAEQRWDVLMSFLSFMLALAISMFLFDMVIPFQEINR